MSLQSLDFLSPPISLYYNDKRTHTSKISGLIVIALMFSCLSYILILVYSTINHLNVTSLIYKKFEWEAGFYQMNSSVLFHFFQIFCPEDGGYFDKYDPKYIRIYTTYVHNDLEQSQLYLYDHWVFDECKEGVDDKEISKDLFENVVNFTNSACVRYYYNSEKKTYYTTGENEFVWPHMEHGISRRDNVFLTTLIEKCSNESVLTDKLGYCASAESIEEYIQRYFGFYLYLLDNSIDPTNYTNPFQNYFQILSTGIGNSKTFVENYIHFAPVRMRTKVGDIFGQYTDQNSFFYDFNRKGTAESHNRILLKNYYLMQNNFNIYERRYNGITDILSNIGGIVQLFFYLFFTVNFLYHNYIIVMDTNHFFCKIENASNEENSYGTNIKSNRIFNPFKNIKVSIMENVVNKKPLKKQVYSVNLDIDAESDIISNGNKSDNNANNKLKNNQIKTFSRFKESNTQIKKNNYVKSTVNSSIKKKEIIKYMNKSNISDESNDFSNIKIKEIENINKEKRLDSIELLKEKNISSTQNNELISEYNDITTKNIRLSKLNTNNNKINFPPKKQQKKKIVHFNEKITKANNNKLSQTVKPSHNIPELNQEIIKNQKIQNLKDQDLFELDIDEEQDNKKAKKEKSLIGKKTKREKKSSKQEQRQIKRIIEMANTKAVQNNIEKQNEKEKENQIYDLWGENTNPTKSTNKLKLNYPKVPLPHPGQSYNPNKKDLNKLLSSVVENNKHLVKQDEESIDNNDDNINIFEEEESEEVKNPVSNNEPVSDINRLTKKQKRQKETKKANKLMNRYQEEQKRIKVAINNALGAKKIAKEQKKREEELIKKQDEEKKKEKIKNYEIKKGIINDKELLEDFQVNKTPVPLRKMREEINPLSERWNNIMKRNMIGEYSTKTRKKGNRKLKKFKFLDIDGPLDYDEGDEDFDIVE